MIKEGWSRGFINACLGCIKRLFKWGVENELAPPSTYHGLQAVAGLRKGRSEATEMQPIRPVIDEHVEAVVPFVSRAVQAMIQVQRLSGARPGEIVIMRPRDIDQRKGETWIYRPESHKTEHHGISRAIFLGPQAQEILKPFLSPESKAAVSLGRSRRRLLHRFAALVPLRSRLFWQRRGVPDLHRAVRAVAG